MITPTSTLIVNLSQWLSEPSFGEEVHGNIIEAAERMETMRKLLERAADIVEYHHHKESSPTKAKWLADAKEIGITPCPF